MNGDGKADYVWLRPENGEIRCWINNLPEPWSPAGTNEDIIGSGAGREESVFLAVSSALFGGMTGANANIYLGYEWRWREYQFQATSADIRILINSAA
jgi:hypothetical protein